MDALDQLNAHFLGTIDRLCAPAPEPLHPVTPRALIDQICGHLSAAECQIIDTDDQIIANHVRAALTLARILREDE